MGMFRPLLFSALVLAGFSWVVSGQRNTRAPLELVKKGYVNLLIGINERVPEDPALLDRIQFVFTETSKFLYKATNQRAYFKDIHILVPETWSNSDAYSNVDWQRYDQSDVIVDLPSDNGSNRPYTNKPTPCGEPGLSIQLTPDYILSQSIAGVYGDYDKALVHEWAHYRWGVFDEFPLEAGQHFYADEDGEIQAVRCVLGITGKMVNPSKGFRECEIDEYGLPERDCRFLDNTNDVAAASNTGSLMYKQFLPQITTFCEKSESGGYKGNTHNRDAPNLQNLQCQGKSIWEVMLEHEDFKSSDKEQNSVNGEDEVVNDPVPKFTVVKRESSRIVLVLDRSGSMTGQRIIQLRQAAELLITQILADGEELGIVIFNGRAMITSELQVINDNNREMLLKQLPSFADGATSIGAGVQLGLEVLERDGSAAGGKMLVITDGEENKAPFVKDILHMVNESGVAIDTIAIGPDASPSLELLSSSTGGRAYNHDENSNSLADAFSKSATTERAVTSVPVSLYMDFVKVQVGTNFTDAVYIDSTIGRNTQFIFGHVNMDSISVSITDPDGEMISEGSPEYASNTDFKQIRVAIPGHAKIGLWKFQVENKRQEEENVTILVQSHAREGGDPIVINARWGLESVAPPQRQSLYVFVGKGNIPVINSDVRAEIDRPCDNKTVTLKPRDDGIGADVRMNDGVYSAYFTEFCGEGRYGANIDVTSKGRVTSIAFGSVIGAGAAADPTYGEVDGESLPELTLQSTGDFQRVTVGGSFKCEVAELCNDTVDRYPPSRITDLKATNVDIENMQIALTFTAPGDDLMNGQVSRYIIKRSFSSSDLYDNFEAAEEILKTSYVTGDVSVTSNAGDTEVFVVNVTKVGSFSYYFSVVGVDDEDNHSEPSNVASSSARDFSKFPMALVIGISAGGALLIIILIALAVLVCRKIQPKRANSDGSGKMDTTEKNMNHYSIDVESKVQNRAGVANTVGAANRAGVANTVGAANSAGAAKLAGATNRGGAASWAGPEKGAEAVGFTSSEPVYDNVISRRGKDPNWDPNLPNNREGGGAHIKKGHVSSAVSMFDNQGFIPDKK